MASRPSSRSPPNNDTVLSNPHPRLFTPGPLPNGPRPLTKYYPSSGLTFLKPLQKATTSTTLTLSIDGACPSNGNNPTTASWGIYFGPNSPYNTFGLLPPHLKKTTNIAELHAALRAIQLVAGRVRHGSQRIEEVVLMCDSDWMVNSLTVWIENWKGNGWRTSEGKRVKNRELIMEVDELIDEVALLHGIKVKFWHVERMFNIGADRMANLALTATGGDEEVWEGYWKRQVKGLGVIGAKQIWDDVLSLGWDAVDEVGPRLLCLEFPVRGKGKWLGALRTFLFLHLTRKLESLFTDATEREEMKERVCEEMFGRNWRVGMNKELTLHREDVNKHIQVLKAVKEILSQGKGSMKIGERSNLTEVNNHLVMVLAQKSLHVYLPLERQHQHILDLEQRLQGPKWDMSWFPKQDLSEVSQSDPVIKPASVPRSETASESKSSSTVHKKPRQAEEPLESGVRLDWQSSDEWVEVDYPSS